MSATTTTQNKLDLIIKVMSDEAEKLGGNSNDENGAVRHVVTQHSLGFDAWFCVCCELANRSARSEGFKNSIDRAVKAVTSKRKIKNQEMTA